MRVALMPSAYAPAVGGVEVLTARLAHKLTLAGHEVEVWAPRSEGDGLTERDEIDGITVRRFVFPMPRAHLATLAAFPRAAGRTLSALRAAVAEFRPTHLHVQCFSGNGAYATALNAITGIPLIVTLQGETVMDDHDIYDRSATLRLALRWGLRRAAHVTGCSQFTLDDAHRRFGLSRTNASVIFNGVDLDEVEPHPVGQPFDRYVLALGRVVHKKGFDLLIDAFSTLARDIPDVGLVIGGTGAQLPELRSQAARLGLSDRVYFPGRLDRGQVAALMAGAEVFVMPSRVEPFGIVILEAWRAGVPVIATIKGGPPEFVTHGVSGLLADPTDRPALAQALRLLLTQPERRRELACHSRDRVDDFTWPAITRQYELTYRRTMGDRRVPTSSPLPG